MLETIAEATLNVRMAKKPQSFPVFDHSGARTFDSQGVQEPRYNCTFNLRTMRLRFWTPELYRITSSPQTNNTKGDIQCFITFTHWNLGMTTNGYHSNYSIYTVLCSKLTWRSPWNRFRRPASGRGEALLGKQNYMVSTMLNTTKYLGGDNADISLKGNISLSHWISQTESMALNATKTYYMLVNKSLRTELF